MLKKQITRAGKLYIPYNFKNVAKIRLTYGGMHAIIISSSKEVRGANAPRTFFC